MAANGYQLADEGDDYDNLFGDEDDFQFDEEEQHAGDQPDSGDFAMPGDMDDDLKALIKNETGQDVDLDNILAKDPDSEAQEKADNAVDYEDFDLSDDDDLVDESGPGGPVRTPQQPSHMLMGIEDSMLSDDDGDIDDLFGGPSSPAPAPDPTEAEDDGRNAQSPGLASEPEDLPADKMEEEEAEFDELQDAQYRTQLALFALSGKSAPTTEQENIDEWLRLEYPQFKRGEVPFFNRLFPPKPQAWTGKVPAKPPKPVRPTKVTLELDQDQKILFNSNTGPTKRTWEHDGNIAVIEAPVKKASEDESSDDSDFDEPLPGGISMQDLDIVCADFETLSGIAESDNEAVAIADDLFDDDVEMFGNDDFIDHAHPIKKRRLGMDPHEIVSIHHYNMPSFDDYERMTEKIGRRVVLDLNDPRLLVEEIDPEVAKSRLRSGEVAKGPKTVKEKLKNRFNHSNDVEYDLLKQNHQHKVRSQLARQTIDHSIPALRLQYPYYKVKLSVPEMRTFHRKRMEFRHLALNFKKANKMKRKTLKNKEIKDIYLSTKDLSLGDNSTSLLLEYCEEHPMTISLPGMGAKVLNYYRRQNKDDTTRPKLEIGETSVLLPEDKSPFSVFGTIDPGETVMSLYTPMYRAPIFEQQPRSEDFLIIREHTGMDGSTYYLRNVDHAYVVGQEFPSVAVPGPHSRVVTTAAKNRLKAISFRIARRKKSQRLRVEDVTRHFPDSTDMQNRQKMKEFMVFSKEHKEWEMKPNEALPEEEYIRTLIHPEDVCLLESMQVGQQYLLDAGYGQENDFDEDDTKEVEGQAQTVDQELAPWKATKNFLQASQGKAMLKLNGDGDPSGRGEGYSFIKTSMKGGFKDVGEGYMDAQAVKKELGGHSYNVARQQQRYDQAIRRIWEAQKASLSSKEDLDDGAEDGVDGQNDDGFRPPSRSGTQTPAFRRRDDDASTLFSRRSIASQTQKVLKISRQVRRQGEMVIEETVETNPAVIKQYLRIKDQQEIGDTSIKDAVPTGDLEFDARQRKRMEEEVARLEKNRDRRLAREKAKGITSAMSPDGTEPPTPASGKPQGTQRKCANCGQVGHIKTNKKLCPLLNGTIKQEDGFNNAAFMGAPPTLP